MAKHDDLLDLLRRGATKTLSTQEAPVVALIKERVVARCDEYLGKDGKVRGDLDAALRNPLAPESTGRFQKAFQTINLEEDTVIQELLARLRPASGGVSVGAIHQNVSGGGTAIGPSNFGNSYGDVSFGNVHVNGDMATNGSIINKRG